MREADGDGETTDRPLGRLLAGHELNRASSTETNGSKEEAAAAAEGAGAGAGGGREGRTKP